MGGFLLAIGNMLLFLLVEPTQQISAWFLWVSGQGVLNFYSNTYSRTHRLFLVCYMISMLYCVTQSCLENPSLWVHAMAVYTFSILFGAVDLMNLLSYTNQKSVQAIFELYWMLSFVYFYSVAERDLTT